MNLQRAVVLLTNQVHGCLASLSLVTATSTQSCKLDQPWQACQTRRYERWRNRRPVHKEYGGPEDSQWDKPIKFVSLEKEIVAQAPFKRLPITFPDIKLSLLKPKRAVDLELIKHTGWCREAIFKTTPNVTKPEIKAFLESVYGMEVERIHAYNMLGTPHVIQIPKRATLTHYRENDWKKAYVLFKTPTDPVKMAEIQKILDQQPKRPEMTGSIIDKLRSLRGVGKEDRLKRLRDAGIEVPEKFYSDPDIHGKLPAQNV